MNLQEPNMFSPPSPTRLGLLLSGGLDSSVLLSHLLQAGHRVHPLYIRTGLAAEREELLAVVRLTRGIDTSRLEKLTTLDLPLADLSGTAANDFSLPANGPMAGDDTAEAGGNIVLLIAKAAVWCQRHGIERLAVGLRSDGPLSSDCCEYLGDVQAAVSRAQRQEVEIAIPFETLDRRHIMQLGQQSALELTFSCSCPVGGLHCGQCSKCIERQAAFRTLHRQDATRYAGAMVAYPSS